MRIATPLLTPGSYGSPGLRCQEMNLTTENDMTNANERYEGRASDPVEEIKARIRWLNEMLKQLQFKTPAKETKH